MDRLGVHTVETVRVDDLAGHYIAPDSQQHAEQSGDLSDEEQNLAELWHAQGPGAVAFLNKSPLQHAYDENARINAETDARRKMLRELAFDLARIDDKRLRMYRDYAYLKGLRDIYLQEISHL